jgi:hypothetical protein
MLALKLLERWQQIFAMLRAECGRLALEDDRPVRKSGRHGASIELPKLPKLPKPHALYDCGLAQSDA